MPMRTARLDCSLPVVQCSSRDDRVTARHGGERKGRGQPGRWKPGRLWPRFYLVLCEWLHPLCRGGTDGPLSSESLAPFSASSAGAASPCWQLLATRCGSRAFSRKQGSRSSMTAWYVGTVCLPACRVMPCHLKIVLGFTESKMAPAGMCPSINGRWSVAQQGPHVA